MAVNPYLNSYNHLPTQDLIENLTIEAIQAKGMDMFYLPRTLVSEDILFGEDRESSFSNFHTVEMYMLNVENFGGDGDMMSKFGLQLKNTVELVVSRQRFYTETDMDRPIEGDLVYFPLTKALLVIDYVDFYNPFYQAGSLYVYKLKCSLFEYGHESLVSGLDEIDQLATTFTANVSDDGQDPFDNAEAIGDLVDPIKDNSEHNPFGEW